MGTDAVSEQAGCMHRQDVRPAQGRRPDLQDPACSMAMLRASQPEGPCRSPLLPSLLHHVLTQGAGQQPTL